jgi:hypothetical protein
LLLRAVPIIAAFFLLSGAGVSWAAFDIEKMAGHWEVDRSRYYSGTAEIYGISSSLTLREGYVDIENLGVTSTKVRARYSFNFVWVIDRLGYPYYDYDGVDVEWEFDRYQDVIVLNNSAGTGETYTLTITIQNEDLAYVEEDYTYIGSVHATYYLKRAGSSGGGGGGGTIVPTYPRHPGETEVVGGEQGFDEVNVKLEDDGVTVLPGNRQSPIDPGSDRYLVGVIPNPSIFVEHPAPGILPSCFESLGRSAAYITINIGPSPDGKMALLPMTYQVVMSRHELENVFGSERASAILADTSDYIDDIFELIVIQKEVKEGAWRNYFTRLAGGVLSPQAAVNSGIMSVYGGSSLSITLNYYLLDGPRSDVSPQEAFVENGYLIVPDGHTNGVIRDQIWLSKVGPTAPSGVVSQNGYEGNGNNDYGGDGRSGGGGGCNAGGLSAPLILICALYLVRSKRSGAA